LLIGLHVSVQFGLPGEAGGSVDPLAATQVPVRVHEFEAELHE